MMQEIFKFKTIAVVGCSNNPSRPSYYVSEYMQNMGYKIVPVNPGHSHILGEACYPKLSAIPHKIDTVLIFRQVEFVPEIVQEAIKIGAKAIWMQDSIYDSKSGQKAQDAGLMVVMDDCMMRVHQNQILGR